jgi:hypothetical protein
MLNALFLKGNYFIHRQACFFPFSYSGMAFRFLEIKPKNIPQNHWAFPRKQAEQTAGLPGFGQPRHPPKNKPAGEYRGGLEYRHWLPDATFSLS